MKALDRYLRDVRIRKAGKFVQQGDVVVDVGCADGTMFERWRGVIEYGHGVDPILEGSEQHPGYTLHGGLFPQALPPVQCNLITMLAVLEHIPPVEQEKLAASCHELLEPGGRIVITVPSPRVDDILELLGKLRLIDGMSVEEHYGFDPTRVPEIFPAPGFRLLTSKRFQLGLNNLFVFERLEAGAG